MIVKCKDIICEHNSLKCAIKNKIKECNIEKCKNISLESLLSNEKSFIFVYNYSKSHLETILFEHLYTIYHNIRHLGEYI